MHLSRVFCLDLLPSLTGAGARLAAAASLLLLSASLTLAQSPGPSPVPAPASVPTPAPPASVPAASAPAAAVPAAAAASAPAARPAASAAMPSNRLPASAARAASGGKSNGKQATKPLWRELKPAEQIALTPLAGTWDTLNVAQKRKWLALSHNYPKLTPDEQAKLHSRMSEWVALSPQQRTLARLNFGATQQLSPDDKKAKWEAYQALSPEEKSKLAARASKPPAAAPAVKPVPPEKLATIPKPKLGEKAPPRAALAPANAASGAQNAASGAQLPVSTASPASTPVR